MTDLTGFLLLIALVTAFIIGVNMGLHIEESIIREEAIEANCAYYDTKTAEFKWNVFSGNKQ